jgi:hypothetical protein
MISNIKQKGRPFSERGKTQKKSGPESVHGYIATCGIDISHIVLDKV